MRAFPTHRLQDLAAAAACLALVLAFAGPMLRHCEVQDGLRVCRWVFTQGGGTDDWRMFSGAWEAARVSLLEYHQWPSWNPWHCGGIVLYQDPQAGFPGPLFLLTFWWLPAVAGMKVWIVGHLFAGALGAWAVVRSRGGHPGEGLLAAAMVSACGFCAEHFGGGHASFAPFLLFPWLLLAHRKAVVDPRWTVVTASLLAVCVFSGATYPLPLMAVGLGIDSLLRLGDPAARRGLVVALPLTALLFVLLSAVRLLPVLAFLLEHPRLMPLDDSMTVAEVIQTWVTRDHPRAFPGHVYVWPEYGNYIGVVPVTLLGVALVVGFVRRDALRADRRADLYLLAGLVWCALGNIPGFSLFGLLHELPVYRSLRVPSRFLHPATVAAALAVSALLVDARKGLESLRVRPVLVRAFILAECLLALGVAVDICRTNAPRLQQGVDPPIPAGSPSPGFHQDPGAPYWRWPTFPVTGVGTPACYAAFEWEAPRGLWMGRVPQERLDPPEAGAVRPTRWSPNVLTWEVSLQAPATLLVNQHADSGWSSDAGPVSERDGLVALDLPAGRRVVTLRHSPRGLGLGALLSLLGVALAVVVGRRLSPDRRDALLARAAARLLAPTAPAESPPEALPEAPTTDRSATPSRDP